MLSHEHLLRYEFLRYEFLENLNANTNGTTDRSDYNSSPCTSYRRAVDVPSDMCAKRGLKSAGASAHFDQSSLSA